MAHAAAPEVAARPAAHATGAALPPTQLLPGGQSGQMNPAPASMRWRPGGQPVAPFQKHAVPVQAEGPAAMVLPSDPCSKKMHAGAVEGSMAVPAMPRQRQCRCSGSAACVDHHAAAASPPPDGRLTDTTANTSLFCGHAVVITRLSAASSTPLMVLTGSEPPGAANKAERRAVWMADATPPGVRSRSVSRMPPASGKVGQPYTRVWDGGGPVGHMSVGLDHEQQRQEQRSVSSQVGMPVNCTAACKPTPSHPLTCMLRCCGTATALQTDEYCHRAAPGAGNTSSRQLLSTWTAKRAKQVACAAAGSVAVARAKEMLPTTGQLPAGGAKVGGEGAALHTMNGWHTW